MKDERRPARNTAAHTNRHESYREAWSALDELERDVFLRTPPGASRVWLHAPADLRRQHADGRIDAAEFWRATRQWLEFETRAA